jgi:hypothetical protein
MFSLSVLYFSIHRYDNGNFWPNLRESDFDCIGEGAGKGFNINVPLNKVKQSKFLLIFRLKKFYFKIRLVSIIQIIWQYSIIFFYQLPMKYVLLNFNLFFFASYLP